MTIGALKLDVGGEDREVEVCGSRRKGSSGGAACVRERRWPTARPRKSSWTRFCMRHDKRHPAHTSIHASHTHKPPARVNDARAQWNCDDKRHHLRHSQPSTHSCQLQPHHPKEHTLAFGKRAPPTLFFFCVRVAACCRWAHARGWCWRASDTRSQATKIDSVCVAAPNSHPCHTSCSNTGTLNRGHVGDEPSWAHTQFPFSQPPNTHGHCVSLCAFERGAGHERQSYLQWEAVIRRGRQCQTRLREPGRDPSQRMMCT
jgi:hypothetical protein